MCVCACVCVCDFLLILCVCGRKSGGKRGKITGSQKHWSTLEQQCSDDDDTHTRTRTHTRTHTHKNPHTHTDTHREQPCPSLSLNGSIFTKAVKTQQSVIFKPSISPPTQLPLFSLGVSCPAVVPRHPPTYSETPKRTG